MVRQSILKLPEAQTYIQLFEADLSQYVPIALDAAVWVRTQTLLDTYAVSASLTS